MTAADPAFLRSVVEDLAPLGPIQQRPYFGGVALMRDDKQFAFIMGSNLFLATDDGTRPILQEQGGEPFEYLTRSGPRVVEAYYSTPVHTLKNSDKLLALAKGAIATRRTLTRPSTSASRPRRS